MSDHPDATQAVELDPPCTCPLNTPPGQYTPGCPRHERSRWLRCTTCGEIHGTDRQGTAEMDAHLKTQGHRAAVVQAAPLKLRDGDQQLPTPNQQTYVQHLVIRDIEERLQVGIRRYGTGLQPWNGRRTLRDAYEEALDLAMYLRQLIEEQDGRAATWPPDASEDFQQGWRDGYTFGQQAASGGSA